MVRNIIGKIFSPQPSGNHHEHNYGHGKGQTSAYPEVCRYTLVQINKKGVFTIGVVLRETSKIFGKTRMPSSMMSFAVRRRWPTGKRHLNQYSPATIFQELDWCEQIHAEGGKVTFGHVEPLLFKCENGLFIDMHIGGYVPVTKERALGRRQEIYDVFAHVFSSAVVIMTLGMIEVWYDLKNHLFIKGSIRENEERHGMVKFICLSYRSVIISKIDILNVRHRPECSFS
jgi:hypothetical protein